MSALSTIKEVKSVRPIPEADAIEVIDFTDCAWEVVVRKDIDIQVGDLVVYFEPNAVLPDLPQFEEMLKGRPWSQRAARLKPRVIRGQMSYGYARPLRDLIEHLPDYRFSAGADLTTLLNVTRYEAADTAPGSQVAGHWLPGVPRTDEERVQSTDGSGRMQRLRDYPYVITIKYDGMSGTFGNDEHGQFWECSRKYRVKPGDHAYGRVSRKYDLAGVIANHPSFVVQGEVYGEGIMKNRLGIKGVDLAVFDVWDNANFRYLSHTEVEIFCRQYGLPTVPVLEHGSVFDYTLDDLLDLSRGVHPLSGKAQEGIVIRSNNSLIPRVSFKVINPDFITDGGE